VVAMRIACAKTALAVSILHPHARIIGGLELMVGF